MDKLVLYVIFFFVFLAIAGVFLLFNFLYESFVEKRMKQYALDGGHKYLMHMDNTLRPFLSKTQLTSGSSWAKFPLVHRTAKGGVTTAVWFNRVSSGKSSHTYSYQIAIMPVSFRTTGRMFMRKEHLGDKFKNVFGMNDLDFEHSEFSDKYYVTADPEKFGYDFFHPRMIELFLKNRQYFAMIRSDHLIVYRSVPVKKGLLALFGLIGREIPQIAWMEEARDFILEVEKNIPKMMKTGG